jgi:hypothetical protein
MQAQTLLEAALTLYQDNRASKHAKDLHGLMCQHGYALPSEERRDHDNPSAT